MKKLMIILLTGCALFTSCKKEGCTDSTATNFNEKAKKDDGSCTYAQPVVQDGFRWKENGGSETIADSAYWTTGAWGTGIRAYKNGMSNYFEINWSTQNNTAIGSKTIAINDFTFLQNSASYTNAAAGTLSISAFSNNKLSGSCTITVSGSSTKTIDATFGNIGKK